MSEGQILNVALTTIPTMTVVLIGILLNNARLNDVKGSCGRKSNPLEMFLART